MSSMSICVGDVLVAYSASSGCVVSPFVFLILDMCGSFLAFAAAPITNVNLASSSCAMIWRACSLVWLSILVFAICSVGFYKFYVSLVSRSFMCYCTRVSMSLVCAVVALVVGGVFDLSSVVVD